MKLYELARDKTISDWYGTITFPAGTKLAKVRMTPRGHISALVTIDHNRVRINLDRKDLRVEREREAA